MEEEKEEHRGSSSRALRSIREAIVQPRIQMQKVGQGSASQSETMNPVVKPRLQVACIVRLGCEPDDRNYRCKHCDVICQGEQSYLEDVGYPICTVGSANCHDKAFYHGLVSREDVKAQAVRMVLVVKKDDDQAIRGIVATHIAQFL